jgi:putative acyl-CoA dehydrogenase
MKISLIASASIKRNVRRLSSVATHTVFNQSSPLQNINLFKSDVALVDSVKVFGGSHVDHLEKFGVASGTASMMHAAETAEKNRPTLRQFDHYGRRIDVADYHDSYHTLMNHGLENGCAAHGFKHNTAGSHVTRAALIYLENQIEAGHCCPIVMTAAAIPVLKRVPGFETHVQKLLSHKYDPRDVPMSEKEGITMGMSMTEKQGELLRLYLSTAEARSHCADLNVQCSRGVKNSAAHSA